MILTQTFVSIQMGFSEFRLFESLRLVFLLLLGPFHSEQGFRASGSF